RRSWDDGAPVMSAAAVDEIEGDSSTDVNHTDRLPGGEVVGADGCHETIDTQSPGFQVFRRDTTGTAPGSYELGCWRVGLVRGGAQEAIDLVSGNTGDDYTAPRLRPASADHPPCIVLGRPTRVGGGPLLAHASVHQMSPFDARVTDIHE